MLISLLSWFLRKLPLSWALACGRAFGWIWFYLIPIRRGVAVRNVERVFGDAMTPEERWRTVRRSFENLCMMVVEVMRFADMTPSLSAQLVDRRGFERYTRAAARGKGVIAVIGHLGSFEMLGASLAIRGVPLNAVVKDIGSKSLHEFWFAARHRTGFMTIPPRRSKDQIRATLARGEMVVMVIDQHMPAHRGIVCEFFGQLASTSPAPARFALETGAPIVPMVIFRDPDHPERHVVRCEPEVVLEAPYDDPKANLWHNTERINRLVEAWVRERPDQWLWAHKRWKVHDDPTGWEIPARLRHLVAGAASAEGPAREESAQASE